MTETHGAGGSCRVFETSGSSEPDQVDELVMVLRATWQHLMRDVMKGDAMEVGGRQGFWVLSTLLRPRRMSELAGLSDLSSAHLTGIVDRLEARGFVKRERSDEDRRVVMVSLTDEGLKAVRCVHATFRSRFAEWSGRLSPDELKQLTELLRRLTDKKAE